MTNDSLITQLINDVQLEELNECCEFILRDRSCGTKFQREGLVRRLKEYRRPKSMKEQALEILSVLEGRNQIHRIIARSELNFIRTVIEES
jgi:hypothetical protein